MPCREAHPISKPYLAPINYGQQLLTAYVPILKIVAMQSLLEAREKHVCAVFLFLKLVEWHVPRQKYNDALFRAEISVS